jgi:hypothetical protein
VWLGEEAVLNSEEQRTELERRWDIGLYLDRPGDHWRAISGGSLRLTVPLEAPAGTNWRMVDDGGTPLPILRAASLDASKWSRPMQTLWANVRRAHAHSATALQLVIDGSEPDKPIAIKAGESGTPVRLTGRRERMSQPNGGNWGDDGQGIYYAVLLLKKVRASVNVAAAGYAQIGLYDGTDANGRILPTPNSRELSEVIAEVGASLAAMILQIQEAPATVDSSGQRRDTVSPSVPLSWEMLFPEEDAKGKLGESYARILSVSQLIEVVPGR